MKKSLWIIALLFVVIGTPNAHATSYTATFTYTGACAGGIPTAPDVSLPRITITETWDGFTGGVDLFFPFDSPADIYKWQNLAMQSGTPGIYEYLFALTDVVRRLRAQISRRGWQADDHTSDFLT
jgi:hypothetical protein